MPSPKSRSSNATNRKKRSHKDKSPSPKSDEERCRVSEEKKDSSSQKSLSPAIERRKRHKRSSCKRSLSHSPRRGEKESHRDDENGACRCLGVFGLSSYTEERDLKEIFGAYGDIEKLCLIYDKQSGHSKGFGFVYFEYIEHAITARRETQGLVLDGRHIRVDYSLTMEPHPSTPGRYQGRRPYPGYRPSSLRNKNDYYSSRPYYRDRSYSRDSYERRYDRDENEDYYDRSSRKYSSSSRRH